MSLQKNLALSHGAASLPAARAYGSLCQLGDLGPNGKQAVQFWTQTKTVTARWYEDHGSSSDGVNTTISMK